MCIDAGARVGPLECNQLALAGDPIAPTSLGDIAPKGGAITEGVYRLTAFAVAADASAGDPSTTYRQRIAICGASMQVVKELASGGATLATYATTSIALSGATMTLTPSCGTFWDGANAYDATPTTLVLYVRGSYALTFTRE
jgi:hypothetical protein